jgi:MFS family permease
MLKTSRGAIILVFAAFGASVGAHLGAIPVLFKNASLTDLFFGQAQSITMLFSMAAMLLGGYLGRFFDHRALMLAFLPLLGASLVFALMVKTPTAYVVSIILFAGLLSMMDIHMNAEGAVIEEELGRPVYTTYHAAVSALMGITAILSSFLSVTFGPLSSGVFAVLMLAWATIEVARLVKHRPPSAEKGPTNYSALPFGKLLLAGSAIGLGGVCEMMAVIYAGQLLVKLAPSLAEYSGLGVAFFAGCMAIVRIFGDRLRGMFGDQTCLGVSLALSMLGFVTLSFAPSFTISVLAYAMVGTGLSFLSPIMFPLVGRLAPAQRSSAMGLAFATSNIYRFITPAIVGLLVTWYGLNIVFAVCTVFAIGALALGLLSLHLTSNKRGAAMAAPPTATL